MPAYGELALYAGPPTPPKDADIDTDKDLDEVILSLNSFPDLREAQASFNTPPSSSPSRNLPVAASVSSHKRKRARFQPDSSLCDEIPLVPTPSQDAGPCSSTQQTKPPRSILKPFQLQNTPPSPHRFDSFAAMLESLVKMLASPTVSARVDAYNTLHNSLRAYQQIPDAEAFSSKLPLFEQFMQRDMCALSEITGKPDVRLALPAVKLAILLFVDKSLVARRLSPEFLDWLATDTIRVLKSPSVAKEVAKNQLHLLTLDAFCTKTLNPQRAADVITGLQTIHDRVSGVAMYGVRNAIYARLLIQHKAIMLQRLSDWLPIVIRGMWSNVFDIQKRAIDLGLKAADSLGSYRTAAATFNKYCCARALDGRATRFDRLEENVLAILREGSQEAKLEVPRIWSFVMLFLRGGQVTLSQWRYFDRWLDLISKCFSSSDDKLVLRSFTAWNRFLFALKPDHLTKPSLVALLTKPIIARLSREAISPLAPEIRSAAWSSYHLLLFYAFRPGLPETHTTKCWTDLVEKALGSVILLEERDLRQLHELLSALLNESTLRVWNDEQVPVNFMNPIESRQLPKLDPRWVRRNLPTILPSIEKLLRSHIPAGLEEAALRFQLRSWQSLMASVAEAGSKEVTASTEAKRAVAHIVRAIEDLRFLNSSTLLDPDQQASRAFLSWQLLDSATAALGADGFLSAGLPAAQAASPVPAMAYESSEGIVPCMIRFCLSSMRGSSFEPLDWKPSSVLRCCLSAISSSSARLGFLSVIADATIPQTGDIRGSTAEYLVLAEVISQARAIIREAKKPEAEKTGLSQYRDIIKIWTAAMTAQNCELWPLLSDQLPLMMADVVEHRGSDALCVGLLWPLLKHVSSSAAGCALTARLDVIGCCLKDMRPISGSRVSQLQASFQPASPSDPEFSSWLSILASSITSTLAETSSADEYTEECDASIRVLKALSQFCSSENCVDPRYFLATCIPGAGKWLARGSRMSSALSIEAVTNASGSLLGLVEHRLAHTSEVLEDIHGFFLSVFDTTDRSFAQRTLYCWSQTFGAQPALSYPPQLWTLLKVINKYEEIRMPRALNNEHISASLENQLQDEKAYVQKNLPWLTASLPVAAVEIVAANTNVVDFASKSKGPVNEGTQHTEQGSYPALASVEGTLSGFVESQERDSQASFVVSPAEASFEELSNGILEAEKFMDSLEDADLAPSEANDSPCGGPSTPILSVAARPSDLDNEVPSSPLENIQRDRVLQAQRRQVSLLNEVEIPSSPPEPPRTEAPRALTSQLDIPTNNTKKNLIADSFNGGTKSLNQQPEESDSDDTCADEDALLLEQSRKFVPMVLVEVSHSSHERAEVSSSPAPAAARPRRVLETVKRSARGRKKTMNPNFASSSTGSSDSQEDDGLVILRPYKQDTPSFYEVVRQIRSSQASASPEDAGDCEDVAAGDASVSRRISSAPSSSSSKRKSASRPQDEPPANKKQRLTNDVGSRRSSRLSRGKNAEDVRETVDDDDNDDAAPQVLDDEDAAETGEAPEKTETPKRDFSFRSDMTMTDVSASSTPSSQGFVETFTEHFRSLYEDAKKLFLGDSRKAESRRQIEELASNLSREIQCAGERTRHGATVVA